MKLTVLVCLIVSNIVLANNNLCIALTNTGDFAVEFSGLVDSDAYTVKPGSSAILSGEHMASSCIRPDKNDCTVSILILDGSYKNYEIIDHLPRGSRIIYKKLHEYEVDKNANVKCGN